MERWESAVDAIGAADPSMAAFMAFAGPCDLVARRTRGGAFAALAQAIVYQQLAGRAAAAIHGRFAALFGGRPTPAAVAATEPAVLRGVGLSEAKARSIQDLAAKVLDGTVRVDRLGRLADDEVVARLCTVRGIGPWTAEMYLIFELGRPDVWPVGDYGVRAGYARVHGLDPMPTPGQLRVLGDRFRPWRTVAAWYCWRAMDPGVSAPTAGW